VPSFSIREMGSFVDSSWFFMAKNFCGRGYFLSVRIEVIVLSLSSECYMNALLLSCL
jgi:hypothetical protein